MTQSGQLFIREAALQTVGLLTKDHLVSVTNSGQLLSGETVLQTASHNKALNGFWFVHNVGMMEHRLCPEIIWSQDVARQQFDRAPGEVGAALEHGSTAKLMLTDRTVQCRDIVYFY